MGTIKQVEEKIIDVAMKGGDTSGLERELKLALQEQRVDEEAKVEISRLKAVAERRKKYQSAAKAIVNKVETQQKAIDRFIEVRDVFLKSLDDVLGDSEALQKILDEAISQYHFPQDFTNEAMRVPKGYLPGNLVCSILVEKSGMNPSDIVIYTMKFIQQARGVIAGAYTIDHALPRMKLEAEMVEPEPKEDDNDGLLEPAERFHAD